MLFQLQQSQIGVLDLPGATGQRWPVRCAPSPWCLDFYDHYTYSVILHVLLLLFLTSVTKFKLH